MARSFTDLLPSDDSRGEHPACMGTRGNRGITIPQVDIDEKQAAAERQGERGLACPPGRERGGAPHPSRTPKRCVSTTRKMPVRKAAGVTNTQTHQFNTLGAKQTRHKSGELAEAWPTARQGHRGGIEDHRWHLHPKGDEA